MILPVSLLLCVLQQDPVPNAPLPTRGGDIQLPPAAKKAAPTDARPEPEIERFRRDVQSLFGSHERIEQRLFEIGQSYAEAALEPLLLQVARTARGQELVRLMLACRRYGTKTPRIGDELLFQALSRPLGEATRPVIDTLVVLKGAAAKPALQELVRARLAGVRKPAAEALAPLLTVDDLPFALQLSREASLDLQLRGIELLTAIGNEPAQQRLLELLSKDPALAGVACQAIARLGERAQPALLAMLAAPPIDRGYAYAAFALAAIDRSTGGTALPAESIGPLAQRLADPEPLTRALVAVPLADLVYRGVKAANGPRPSLDVAVVDALLAVIEPRSFVPNLDLLRQPAAERLLRLTGRIAGKVGEPMAWRDWWSTQRDTFTGVRARIELVPAAAGRVAITLRQDGRHVRLLGDGLADMPPLEGATEIVLPAEQMLALTQELERGGFFAPDRLASDSALPRTRSLQLSSPEGRCLVAMPNQPQATFDALVTLVQQQVDAELWQLYRVAADEPDRGAWWRAERRWREANPEPVARGRRFAQRVIQRWSAWSTNQRAKALAFLADHPQRALILTAEDGEQAIAVMAAAPELQELDLRLLELAASVPGGASWRQAVELAGQHKGGGPQAVRAVFAVAGPDAVLTALSDASPLVRRAGLAELAIVRDQRASARVVELLRDEDDEVKRAAIVACGQMQLAAAARPLVDLIAAEGTAPPVRREALRALGRVGGEIAFPVLQRAFTAPNRDDKEAALRGLGELQDPRAAAMLAELVVIANGQDIGALARVHLQRQRASAAVPALQKQLERAQDVAIRTELVLLLGSYHEPSAVPDLMDLLRTQKHGGAAAALLSGTTGLDLVTSDQRIDVAEAWYRDNKLRPQWQWLLDALTAAKVPNGLLPEQFVGAGDAPIAELARLLVELPEPRLWTLCASVLRSNAGEDHGMVSMQTPLETREAIAARYRLQVESARAAQGK
jgi:HEAT repeat protein